MFIIVEVTAMWKTRENWEISDSRVVHFWFYGFLVLCDMQNGHQLLCAMYNKMASAMCYVLKYGLCYVLCKTPWGAPSMYRFSLGVDVGTINTRFIMLSSILLIVPFSSLFGSHSSHAYVIMGIMQVSISFHIVSICMPFRVGSPAIVRMVWSAPSAFLFSSASRKAAELF